MSVKTGLELLERRWPKALKNKRVGLLCNPASINSEFVHAADLVAGFKEIKLNCFFGPQHGIRGETQANMVEWEGFHDSKTGLPVYSLYGEHRKPSPFMLGEIDVIVVDLSDIGSRYYTYIWTLELCMKACKDHKKSLVVLDRPNFINGIDVEGPVLNEAFFSFVGLRPLPIRHGMTLGEIALYFRDQFHQTVDLHVVKMEGYHRSMFFDQTGLPWVAPSPNIPTLNSAIVYPGMCLLEGVAVSEGRGTTRPFELFGAPYVDANVLTEKLNSFKLPGVHFRPAYFQPTNDKFKEKLCQGAQLHVIDRKIFKPFMTGLTVIKTLRDLYPSNFAWRKGPYEYERKRPPIDILFGTDRIRVALEANAPIKKIEADYLPGLNAFLKLRKQYLLYS